MKRILLIQDAKRVPKENALYAYLLNNTEIVEEPQKAEAIIILGGDGTLLHAVREYHTWQVPFYGFNFGTKGFMLSSAEIELAEEVVRNRTHEITVRMLKARMFGAREKDLGEEFAFNDFYFERAGIQTAKINIKVNGLMRFEPLPCDALIACTAMGSTAYNANARGIILPLESDGMVLTASAPDLLHNWISSQLGPSDIVELMPQERKKRPVRFLADGIQLPSLTSVQISYGDKHVRLGFPASYDYRRKRLDLQFGQSLKL